MRISHELIQVNPIIAIFTISDTRFRKLIEGFEIDDKSGNLAFSIFKERNFQVYKPLVIPNDKEIIKSFVKYFVEKLNVNVIITIGGTGISNRDITIEAIKEIANKEIPGFGELFRKFSEEEIGVHTILSRACAFTYRKCIIFCLPGSENAVKLAIEKIVLPVLHHILSELYR